MMNTLLAFLILTPASQGEIRWSPHNYTSGNNSVEAEIGALKLPESRRDGPKGSVELAFVRLKSTSENPGPPIIYLDGGPGSSAINLGRIPEYFAVFQKLRQAGDVILLDQRGVGRSRPALVYPGGEPLGDRFFESKESFQRPFIARFKAGAEYFKKQGIDITAYNTEESADDVEAIRQALGVPKISILGFSYGTHLGLSVIRRHGKNLDRVVLVGTEGPDHTSKMPSEGDRQIERIAALVAKDPAWAILIPDFKALVARVMKKLEAQPMEVEFEVSGKLVKNVVGKYGLQHLICRDLGDPRDFPWFPTLFYSIDRGDSRFLSRIAQRRYAQYLPGISIMTAVCDYMSGATPARSAKITEESKTALLGEAMNMFSDDLAKGLDIPFLPDAFRTPVVTNVPTLFISGTLDWNTQPHQAEEVRKTFHNGDHIVIEGAGHEDMLTHPEVSTAILNYFKGGSVAGFQLKLTPPPFLSPPPP